jgi:DNA-binding MarR family transcriptional regulator
MTRFTIDAYVVEVLMRDLVRHDRNPSAFVVYLWLWRQTHGFGRPRAGASLQSIATETGLSKSSVQTALRRLRTRGLIVSSREGPTTPAFFEVMTPWRGPDPRE